MSGELVAEKTFISVVVPMYNEERYIAGVIESLIRQDYGLENMEILLVDGNSTDRTVEIIREYQKNYPQIRVLENPGRTVQKGLNVGVKAAVGEYIVRLDAHAEFAEDYVSQSIAIIQETGATDVGGPMIAKGKNPIQNAIAAAYHSPLVVGNSGHHKEGYEGYGETVFLGTFRREELLALGAYDERFDCNEDDDLTLRILEQGGKVFISSRIKSTYYPRDSYRALFKQRFRYGYWKVAVAKKHGRPAQLSHLLPLCLFLFLIVFSILSIFFPLCRIALGGFAALYLLVDLICSVRSSYTHSVLDVLRLMWIHFVIHFSYGMGYFCGLFRFLPRKI